MDVIREIESAFGPIIKEFHFVVCPFGDYETLVVASRCVLCLVTLPREMEMHWMVLDDGGRPRWASPPLDVQLHYRISPSGQPVFLVPKPTGMDKWEVQVRWLLQEWAAKLNRVGRDVLRGDESWVGPQSRSATSILRDPGLIGRYRSTIEGARAKLAEQAAGTKVTFP